MFCGLVLTASGFSLDTMAVVLIIQFYGRGARSLASDENKTSPGFLEDMRDVLDTFGIPMPPMVSPIWKSGVVRGSYLEEDLTSVRLTFCLFLEPFPNLIFTGSL